MPIRFKLLIVVVVLAWGMFCPVQAQQPTGQLRGGLVCRQVEAAMEIGNAYESGNLETVVRSHLGDACIVLPPIAVIQVTLLRLVRYYDGAEGRKYLVEFTDGQDVYYMFVNQRPPFHSA